MDLARSWTDRADIVVAVGGDGTVADVATGLRHGSATLGIVPAGSTNIIARESGIPSKASAAVRLIFGQHRLETIDVGLAGSRSFLHMAGAGLDSRLFAATNPALKRRIGWLAYVPSATRHVLDAPSRFTIGIDDEQIEVVSPLVIVANGGSIITPTLQLYPGLRRDDGWLDVLIFTAAGPLAISRTLGRLATRSLAKSPFVLRRRAKRVLLNADPPLAVQLDGDVVTETPVEFSIAPAALRVIAPLQPTPHW